jgi:hypothetical protein
MIRPPPVMAHSASRVPDNAVGTVSAPTSALIRTATPALAPASHRSAQPPGLQPFRRSIRRL